MPTNYFTKDLENLGKKATIIADSSRAGFINRVLNGNRNEISPFLNTKSVKINNDYFAEMTQILLNEIQNGQDEIIIIDYNLMNDYKKGDVEKLRFNFGQMDKALRKVYEYTYKNHHRLIFTSLYGVKEEAVVKDERVLINYANRVPYIIVDDEYTRNTALLAGDSISLISQTLLYVSGDKKKRTMVILRGKGSNSNLKILLIGFIILVVMVAVKLVMG